jgi:large subunit ribosomal protein L24e
MKCDFCGRSIEVGTDYIYVDSTGKPIHFCSSKCEKNLLKLKRKPQYVRWTEQYRKEKAIRTKTSAAPAKPEKKEAKAEEHKPKHEAGEKHKEEHKPAHKTEHKPEKKAHGEKPKAKKEEKGK